mgnify:CR=1 FL=1
MAPSKIEALAQQVVDDQRDGAAAHAHRSRARSAREIGWRARTRFSTMLRLISREVPRVATRNREGLTRLICISKRLNTHPSGHQTRVKLGQKWPKVARKRFGPQEELERLLILRLDKICLSR